MSYTMLRCWLAIQTRLEPTERGQATAEYALVMLAAAAIAGLVLAWATKSHAITRMFDIVIEKVVP